ncbi:hypothetical protein G7Z17_g10098 [Cylindrodendrum hubeiense]|uniref:Uncharacterized protein n=1 Tax=Cylindrodendrum hubeiense TaxID=595255 RepID=A0A9P5GZA2_9HYPO|nr:hypothetical protein G7Z17_g10098 [Cylindrodendrum hubeiense]
MADLTHDDITDGSTNAGTHTRMYHTPTRLHVQHPPVPATELVGPAGAFTLGWMVAWLTNTPSIDQEDSFQDCDGFEGGEAVPRAASAMPASIRQSPTALP